MTLESIMMLSVHYFQVKLTHMELPDDLPVNLAEIRQMQQNDRALMDKATRAFVSYIHSYVKHECSVLLRVKGTIFTVRHDFITFEYVLLILLTYVIPDLDFGRLAVGFGLLTLPKMPELKNRKTDFFQPVNIDLNLITYK